MKPEEARFILSAIRPDHPDSTASRGGATAESEQNVRAALQTMASDPDLKLWYEENCRFDRAISEKLKNAATPLDLEATILAGLKMSKRPAWRRFSSQRLLAIAATLMLLTAISYQVLREGPAPTGVSTTGGGLAGADLSDFRRTMLNGIRTLEKFDFISDQPEQLVSWLREQESPTSEDLRLPATLGEAKVAGCKILSWHDRRASLICFLAHDGSGVEHSFHLVIIDGKGLDEVREGSARVATEDGWSTAVWRQGSKIFLLATDSTETAELRRQSERLLAPARTISSTCSCSAKAFLVMRKGPQKQTTTSRRSHLVKCTNRENFLDGKAKALATGPDSATMTRGVKAKNQPQIHCRVA